MRRYMGDVLTACAIMAVAAAIIWQALRFPAGGGNFPIFSAVSVILLCLYWIASVAIRPTAELRERIAFDFSYANLRPMVAAAITAVYFLSIFEVGYFVATGAYMVLASLALGTRSVALLVSFTVGTLAFLYLLFPVLLGFNLPRGLTI